MTATVPFVEEKFKFFNSLCFGGALPPIPIELTNAGSFLGKLMYNSRRKNIFGRIMFTDFRLRISTYFDLPENVLEDLIIHEMIHYHIALNNIRDDSPHGRAFRDMMKDINTRFDRHITVSHKLSPDEAAKRKARIREHWICVSKLSGGKYSVTVCAKTRIFRIYRTFALSDDILEMKWYISADPYFNRYPRCIDAKYFYADVTELEDHLASARPVRIDGRRIIF